jgi:putative transcriptional regulator
MKNNLKLIRERLCLSQAALAAEIGVSQGNISHCEKQTQEVSPDMARKVVALARERGFDVTFDDIYDVSEDQNAACHTI